MGHKIEKYQKIKNKMNLKIYKLTNASPRQRRQKLIGVEPVQ